MSSVPAHPAKFSDIIITNLEQVTKGFARQLGRKPEVLDPFAGVGKIHLLMDSGLAVTTGIELEPEWAAADGRTLVGDATQLPFPDDSFDAVITSPCYGNRMADSHNAQERCKPCGGTGRLELNICPKCLGKGHREYRRNTYRHSIGRALSPNSAGAMQWGKEYKRMHFDAIEEMARVSRGWVVINMSDHIRAKKVVPVTDWWKTALELGDLELVKEIKVKTPRNKFGKNYDSRVDHESILITKVAA